MVNLTLSKMRIGGVPFYYENLSLYHRTLSINDVSSTGFTCSDPHSEWGGRLSLHD